MFSLLVCSFSCAPDHLGVRLDGGREKAALSERINSAAFRRETVVEFDRLDVDKNGQLDASELAVALANMGRKVCLTNTRLTVPPRTACCLLGTAARRSRLTTSPPLSCLGARRT